MFRTCSYFCCLVFSLLACTVYQQSYLFRYVRLEMLNRSDELEYFKVLLLFKLIPYEVN